MVPVAIWGHKLDSNSLYAVVKLVVLITSSNPLVIEVCYLYCYAIKQLIKGRRATETFNKTKKESLRRANLSKDNTIHQWIENDIEAS